MLIRKSKKQKFLEQLNKEITGLEQKAEEYEKMLKELDKEKPILKNAFIRAG